MNTGWEFFVKLWSRSGHSYGQLSQQTPAMTAKLAITTTAAFLSYMILYELEMIAISASNDLVA